jgi:hypothetical protein
VRKGPFFGSLFVALGAGAAIYLYLFAPVSRSIQGYVMTRTDAPDTGIPNIEVDLASETDTSIQRATRTNEKGWFTFPGLPDGTYTVSATLPDGASDEAKNVSRGGSVTLHPRKSIK